MTGYDSHSALVGVFQAGWVVRSTLGTLNCHVKGSSVSLIHMLVHCEVGQGT